MTILLLLFAQTVSEVRLFEEFGGVETDFVRSFHGWQYGLIVGPSAAFVQSK